MKEYLKINLTEEQFLEILKSYFVRYYDAKCPDSSNDISNISISFGECDNDVYATISGIMKKDDKYKATLNLGLDYSDVRSIIYKEFENEGVEVTSILLNFNHYTHDDVIVYETPIINEKEKTKGCNKVLKRKRNN